MPWAEGGGFLGGFIPLTCTSLAVEVTGASSLLHPPHISPIPAASLPCWLLQHRAALLPPCEQSPSFYAPGVFVLGVTRPRWCTLHRARCCADVHESLFSGEDFRLRKVNIPMAWGVVWSSQGFPQRGHPVSPAPFLVCNPAVPVLASSLGDITTETGFTCCVTALNW